MVCYDIGVDVMKTRSAPAPLDLVEAFINTSDLESGADALATPTDLRNWLRARKLIPPSQPISQSNHRQAIQLRESLRRAARGNNGAAVDRRTLESLNEIGQRGSLAVSFGYDGTAHLVPASSGFEAALGRILAVVADSMLTGSWSRLKGCASDDCQWVFYDASKNRSGRWCDMADCGNQAKGRAFRERRRIASRPSRPSR
jgi:predicted RNA-binding Zn ribbon-like protein